MSDRNLRRSMQNAGHRVELTPLIAAARAQRSSIDAALARSVQCETLDFGLTLAGVIERHAGTLDELRHVEHERILLKEIAQLSALVCALVPSSTQCSAAKGKHGRCPNDATIEYEQVPPDGRPAYWLKRCAEHPMRGKRSRAIRSSLIHSADASTLTRSRSTDDV